MTALPSSSSKNQNPTSHHDSVSPNKNDSKHPESVHFDKHQPPDATVSQTTTPDKHEHVLFPPTKTQFGIIQREEERIGLPIHSQNKELKKVLKKNVDPGHAGTVDVGVAKLVASATESVLGVDVKVSANLSVVDTNVDFPNHKHVHIENMYGNINANAKAGFGLTGTGATAGITANAFSTQIGPVSGNLGFGITTGAYVSPTQVTVEVLGTGIMVGEQTGISIFGSSATINVGKLVEDTANHFVHHDPHKHVHDKVDKVKKDTEHVLGIDVVKETVTVQVMEPGKKKVDESVTTLKESIHLNNEGLMVELKESVHHVREELRDSVNLVKDEWKVDIKLKKDSGHRVDEGKQGVHS